MKKIVFATLMCVAAMSAKAQVLTSETVNHIYEVVSNQTNSDFVYNAEKKGNDITTMYVYKICKDHGMMSLKPHVKYAYSYAADGTLTSRVVSRWIESQNDWICTARYDFSLADGKYCAAYSHYNHAASRFDEPVEKMVYSLMSDGIVNLVSYYLRNHPSSHFELVSETVVNGLPILFAEK